MNNELINLLPPERQRALSREYVMRVGVMAAVLVTLLIVAAGALLVPTYVFLTESAVVKQTQLRTIESELSSSNEAALSARLVVLSDETAKLGQLQGAPSASATARSLLSIARPGVMLSGFAYSLANGSTSGTLTITGIAATRDALRSYQLALENAPFAAVADLPVSAYAKDTNIAFTITVTLAP